MRIAVVCTGNICRSPMADVVIEQRVEDAGLDGEVIVDSAGTGGWHLGDPMDPRAADALRTRGYDPTRHRARHFTADWFADHDLVLAMDRSNLEDLAVLAADAEDLGKLAMFRSFDPIASEDDLEVPDPWYGGPEGFLDALVTIERTADNLVRRIPDLTVA